MPSSSRAHGLPSNPRVRARPPAPSQQSPEEPTLNRVTTKPLPRQVRPQKSTGSLPNRRQPPSQRHSPVLRDAPRADVTKRSPDERIEYSSSYRTSDSSAASNGSSILDRILSSTGYASSTTSIETSAQNGRASLGDKTLQRYSQDGNSGSQSGSGEGAIWSRVAAAASSLTISVGKAWTANISLTNGEETPVGQESRLTRSMKAYHLAKAKVPSDLPDWLFEPHERQTVDPSTTAEREKNAGVSIESSKLMLVRPQGLRNIYAEMVATPLPVSNPETSTLRISGDTNGQPSKGSDRLKAMREAKRNAFRSQQSVASSTVAVDMEETSQLPAQRQVQRVGLPSRPVAKRR